MNEKKGICFEIFSSGVGVCLFGATGDLSKKKLIPSLYNLYAKEYVRENFFVINIGSKDYDEESFREYVSRILKSEGAQNYESFLSRNFYFKIDYSDEGRLIGHIVLGVQIVDDLIRALPSFPSEAAILLRHLILSHHGEPDMGTVQLPMTREAMALHLADNLDAKMASLNRIYEEAQSGNRWTEYQSIYSRRFFLSICPEHSRRADIEPEPVSAQENPFDYAPSSTAQSKKSSKVDVVTRVQLSFQELLGRYEKDS